MMDLCMSQEELRLTLNVDKGIYSTSVRRYE